jgi:hypothetical protein
MTRMHKRDALIMHALVLFDLAVIAGGALIAAWHMGWL